MTLSMARQAYDYLKLAEMDKKTADVMAEELELNLAHADVFATPYRNFSVFFFQAAAVFLHLTRLIKNILLLLGTLLLALASSFSDWSVARDLGIMAAGRAVLVALNLTNAVFAFVSLFVNAIAIPVHNIRKPKVDVYLNGRNPRVHVHANGLTEHPQFEEGNVLCESPFLYESRMAQNNLTSLVKNGFFKPIPEAILPGFTSTKSALNELANPFRVSPPGII